jgi:pimeloyl-ACP methyl ester carboxylesterase
MKGESMVARFYMDAPHGQIHGRVAGTAGKPWLVLLHQSPSSSVMFEALIPHLAADFRILAPDNPGFGQSDPIVDVSVAGMGDCIVRAMRGHDIEQAFVFGHHTGAAIAAWLGTDHPELCAAIAMCGPPALTAQQRTILPAMAPVAVPQPDGSHLTALWGKLRAKETSAPPALSTRELAAALSAVSTKEAYQGVADYDFLGALPKIACPLLMFAGQRDSLIDYFPAAQAAAPHAKIITIEDAGGYICDLRPDFVAQLLVDFFLGQSQ